MTMLFWVWIFFAILASIFLVALLLWFVVAMLALMMDDGKF